jgi:hypothetical protein
VSLEVLGGGLAEVDLNEVELEIVGLRNRLDGSGAGVVLWTKDDQSQIPDLQRTAAWQEMLTDLVKRVPKAILTNCSLRGK